MERSLTQAGLVDTRWHAPAETGFYQPIFTACRAEAGWRWPRPNPGRIAWMKLVVLLLGSALFALPSSADACSCGGWT
ncbi:hypothetical protein ACLESO_38950, partial [Pyxidicoccus sp. 3LG]